MRVALHSAPEHFFKSGPPYEANRLFDLVKMAARLGFRCFQIGPTSSFTNIDGHRLRAVLDEYGMQCNVHVGGLYDAEEYVLSEEEHNKAHRDLHRGIELSRDVASSLVSFHPPFFKSENSARLPLSRAKNRFLKLIEEEADFAYSMGIRMAIESFCYPPFIFDGLDDLIQFVSNFPPTKIGVLLEVGHLYQAGFNLDEAIETFGNRLLDVHVHDATLQEDFKKATHLPIGKGSVDFLAMIDSLRRVKYNGWLTLEIHGNETEILKSKILLENLIDRRCH
jgi:sugar phosphate isomerase/epimerase